MTKNYFETTGTILKEEKLANVDYNIVRNSMVLEIISPYPGYHHEVPQFSAPGSVFLITRKPMPREIVARLTKKIRGYFPHFFDAAASMIEINNTIYYGIRVKGLPSYEYIKDLQMCFDGEGVDLKKYRKISGTGIITVKKFFNMADVGDGLFIDADPYMAYIVIPESLSWEKFKKITISIRNNWDFKDFDAALGSIYFHGELWEMVRIFWEKYDHNKLITLKHKYLTELARY